MKKRVSIRTIARKADVHHSTVSLALRRHPSIPEITRARILKIADDLGYRPDPMLSALNAYRREISPPKYRATIAWVNNFKSRDAWKKLLTFREFFMGAAERAEQLGYKLDEFWLRERGMTPAHANKVLAARNISGLLIAPQDRSQSHITLDWSRFSAVTIGYTLTWPQLHLVTNHHFRAISHIIRRLRSLGYRRIGLVIPKRIHDRSPEYLGAYKVEQLRVAAKDRIPELISSETDNREALRAWFKARKPEVIIAQQTEIVEWLRADRIRVPGDVGVALTGLHEDGSAESGYSGINPKSKAIGVAAMDLLSGMLNRREEGIPEIQQCLLIEGVWKDGSTTRRINL